MATGGAFIPHTAAARPVHRAETTIERPRDTRREACRICRATAVPDLPPFGWAGLVPAAFRAQLDERRPLAVGAAVKVGFEPARQQLALRRSPPRRRSQTRPNARYSQAAPDQDQSHRGRSPGMEALGRVPSSGARRRHRLPPSKHVREGRLGPLAPDLPSSGRLRRTALKRRRDGSRWRAEARDEA
jgi:hypothetical protein